MDSNNNKIKKAIVNEKKCVACGYCANLCPKHAITIKNGSYAKVNTDICVGCKLCKQSCPASAISIEDELDNRNAKKWYEYLWIVPIVYLTLGFVNILFAWIGLLCFFIPLFISLLSGTKLYCNKYCGRGQLFHLLGSKNKCSLKNDTPVFLKSNLFRYLFLVFFLLMFVNMIYVTYLVLVNVKDIRTVVTLFWTFNVPWDFAYHPIGFNSVSQFAFGFYSIMLTSTLIGFILMILYKPRTWCVICPMGTMTQLICKIKKKK